MILLFNLCSSSGVDNVLLNNCKQNITSLSLLVGTTVLFKISQQTFFLTLPAFLKKNAENGLKSPNI